MKTSDVLDIGYGRVFGFGRISSRFGEIDPKAGGVWNTVKMVRDGDKGTIIDFVKLDQYAPECFDLESMLELVAHNDKFLITVHVSTPLDSAITDELLILKGLNTIDHLGNACSASYDPVNRCIEAKAYITFVGFDIQNEESAPNEVIDFDSSPEIEGFINLLCQVLNVVSEVTHFVSKDLIK